MSYFPSISQNVIVSTQNTTTTNLASGAYFIGGPDDTSAVSGIQFIFHADQNCTISIEQSSVPSLGMGTVTTNGTTSLVGIGTFFTRDFKVGDEIMVDGESTRTITVITSNTNLTVSSAFSTNSGGLSYTQYFWDVHDDYPYNVIKDNMGITVQAVAIFVRAKILNLGLVSTTFLRFELVLIPIIEALPRSLDENGSLKCAVHDLSDEYGNAVKISPMGTMEVDQPYRLVGTSFTSAIDTNFWTAANNGTGSASGVANSIATLNSGTAANSWASLTTVRTGRFIFAHPMKFRCIIRRPSGSGSENTIRRFGPFTSTAGSAGVPPTVIDGFAVELSGSTVLNLNCYNAGVITQTVSNGSFNGKYSSISTDNNAHSVEIIYFIAEVKFFYDDILLHTFSMGTSMFSSNFNLPVNCHVIKTTTDASFAVVELWAGMILRMGREMSAPAYLYQPTAVAGSIVKRGPGTLRGIVNGDNVGTVIFYDALTATNIIASFDLARATGGINIGIDFYTGLTITVTGTPKLTIIYE